MIFSVVARSICFLVLKQIFLQVTFNISCYVWRSRWPRALNLDISNLNNSTDVWSIMFRVSNPEAVVPRCSVKKGVLRNFAEFTGKHLSQSLFFNKVAGLSLQFYYKGDWHKCFPVNFVKLLRTPFVTEHLWWLIWNSEYYI